MVGAWSGGVEDQNTAIIEVLTAGDLMVRRAQRPRGNRVPVGGVAEWGAWRVVGWRPISVFNNND